MNQKHLKYGYYPLHLVADDRGGLNMVKYLVEHGAAIDLKDETGHTAFLRAAQSGELEIVKYLEGLGAELEVKNISGEMAIDLAAKNNYNTVVDYLKPILEKRQAACQVLLGCRPSLGGTRGPFEFLPVEIKQRLFQFLGGHSQLTVLHFERIFNYAEDRTTLDAGYTRNSFLKYVFYNHELEIKTGGRPKKRLKTSREALSTTQNQSDEFHKVDLLQSQLPTHQSGNNQQPISTLAQHQLMQILSLIATTEEGDVAKIENCLQSGAKLMAKLMDDRNTALLIAARKGQLNAVNCLITYGAILDAKDANGYTALHWAAQYGHLQVVKYLVAQGVHLDVKSKNGDTALMNAAKNGFLGVMKHLVENRASILIKNQEGKTAQVIAKENYHNTIVSYLTLVLKLKQQVACEVLQLSRPILGGRLGMFNSLPFQKILQIFQNIDDQAALTTLECKRVLDYTRDKVTLNKGYNRNSFFQYVFYEHELEPVHPAKRLKTTHIHSMA